MSIEDRSQVIEDFLQKSALSISAALIVRR